MNELDIKAINKAVKCIPKVKEWIIPVFNSKEERDLFYNRKAEALDKVFKTKTK